MRLVDSDDAAIELAREVLSPRRRPLVVISTAIEGAPAFDAAHVARELDGSADVVTLTTGAASRAFERAMPEKSQVFGGAARSYPRDFGADPQWRRSVLRFPAQHTVDDLIEDALGQTAVTVAETASKRRWVSAIVERVSGFTGNVARLESGEPVMIVADRLPPALPLVEGLVVGGPVEGWLTGLDLAPEPADVVTDHLEDGTVVLARVVKVTGLRAHLSIHPLHDDLILRRRDVIPGADAGENPDTAVSDIVRVGQTVRARVERSAAGVALTLVDVDPTAPAQSLPVLRGGSPWLEEGVDVPGEQPEEAEEPDAAPEPIDEPTQPMPAPAPIVSTAPSAELRDVRDELAQLRAEVRRLGQQLRAGTDLETLDELTEQNQVLMVDLQRERERIGELRGHVARLNQELREARGGRAESVEPARTSPEMWPDAESWVRHEVTAAWAVRVVAAEKARYPLASYLVGPAFAQSLAAFDEGRRQKALRTVVDVLTGRAADVGGRELHELRTGMGGNDAVVVRADGAVCWRAAIEQSTPSARRLHYWRLPDGRIELSRVVVHDDYEP